MNRRALSVALLALLVTAAAGLLGRSRLRRVYRQLAGRPGASRELVLNTQSQLEQAHRIPLESLRWISGSSAALMRPDDPVVGVRTGGKAWAIPWWVMKNHHAANLDLDGTPYLISFCERCTGVAAFDPIVDGKRLRFRIGGSYRGTPLFFDDDTGSGWDSLGGTAVRGPLAGRTLRQRPIIQSVWRDWLAANPETLVPDGDGERRDGHGSKNYPGDPISGRGLTNTILKLDDRLPPATMVLGVAAGTRARCYPFFELDARGGTVADTFEERPIVAVKRPGTFEALVFERLVDGNEVELRFEGGALVDARTKSRFTMFGEAVGGPLAGKTLPFVPSGVEEFNTWAAHHPGAEIFAWTPEKATAAAAAAATAASSSRPPDPDDAH